VLWVARIYIADYSQNGKVCRAAYENVLRHLQVAGIDLSYNRVDQHIVRAGRLEMEKRPLKERLASRVELFDALNEAKSRQLADSMRERIFSAGQTIVAEDDGGSSMFIVAEGVVGVWKKDSNGAAKWVANIEPGHYFGEMSLLTGQPRSATVKAATETICFEVDKDIMQPFFQEDPALLEKISLIMENRHHLLEKVDQETSVALGERKDKSGRLLTQMMDFFGFGRTAK
jgi:CRP-like cAMP-binding protein